MANVTFIGLGRMGLGMAQRLHAAGHRLRIYNRTPARAAALVEQGATLCASPGEAAEGAELIISMVADDAASREVWLGEQGVLADAAYRRLCELGHADSNESKIIEVARAQSPH